MKGRDYGRIGPREVMWWAAASFLGLGRFGFPRALVMYSGMGAAYAFIGIGLAAYASSWLILALMRRFPGCTAIDVAIASMGWLGRIFEATMGAVMLLILVEAYSLFSFMLHESSLQYTPSWALLALAALATGYGVSVGVEAVSRTLQFLGPILLVISIIGVLPAFGGVRLTFLIPQWTGWRQELAGTYRSFFILGGLQSLFIFSGLAAGKGLRRGVMAGVTVNLAVLAFIFVATMGSLGVGAMPLVSWPAALVAKAITLPSFYIESVGYLSMIAAIGSVILFLIETTVTVAIAMNEVLGLPRSAWRTLGYAIVALTAVAAAMMPNAKIAEAIALTVICPLTVFMLFGKPLLLWAASSRLAGRGARAAQPTSSGG